MAFKTFYDRAGGLSPADIHSQVSELNDRLTAALNLLETAQAFYDLPATKAHQPENRLAVSHKKSLTKKAVRNPVAEVSKRQKLPTKKKSHKPARKQKAEEGTVSYKVRGGDGKLRSLADIQKWLETIYSGRPGLTK